MFAPLTAVSPDNSLLAVHINASSSNSSDDTKRVMIKCYDASVSLSSLKFTLSAKISARLDVLKFASSQHLLAASSTQNELYIFDVHRGVHSHTIDITLGDFRSVAVSKSNDNEVYVLVHRKGKLLALHYDLEHKNVKGGAVNKATLKKKIKLGSCDEEDVHSLSLALIEDQNKAKGSFLAVRVGKKIKVVNVQDGKTSYKLKIKSNSDGDGDSTHNDKTIAPSGTNMNVSNDGSLLTVATSTGLYFFSTTSQSNIGTCAHLPNIQQVFIHSLAVPKLKSSKSKAQKYIVLANCSSSNGESSRSHLFHVQEQQSKKVNSKAFATITPPSNKSNASSSGTSVVQSFFSKHEVIMAELAKVGFQNVNVQMNRLPYQNDDDGNNNDETTFRHGNLYPLEEDEKDQSQAGGSGSKSSSKKRKTNIVLGPGETGGESLTVTDGIKRARTAGDDDDDDDEMDFELEPEDDVEESSSKEGGTTTIAQRLALLSSELERGDSYSEDEGDDDHWRTMVGGGSGGAGGGAASGGSSSTKFAARHATSDSLLILLRQALQSNDDAQLEVALQVSDKRVIENSIMALQRESVASSSSSGSDENDDSDGNGHGELMIMLLTKLVTRISRKPARAPQLQFWIRTVLVALLSSTSSSSDGLKMGKMQKDVAARLAPLRSMLSERVESLPALLRLEGRLSLIGRIE